MSTSQTTTEQAFGRLTRALGTPKHVEAIGDETVEDALIRMGCEALEMHHHARAVRIATIASIELITSEGERVSEDDTYSLPGCQADDHMRDCIAHLCQHGIAVLHEDEHGGLLVQIHYEDDSIEGLLL